MSKQMLQLNFDRCVDVCITDFNFNSKYLKFKVKVRKFVLKILIFFFAITLKPKLI